MIKIESGIPLPKPTHKGGTNKRVYPFEDMNVGDSFEIPLKKWMTFKSLINNRHKRHPERYTVRKVDNIVRCWRIK